LINRHRNFAARTSFSPGEDGIYIILDKRSWFSVISKPYQKCARIMGILKDPWKETVFSTLLRRAELCLCSKKITC
jgi:hypothetical protein